MQQDQPGSGGFHTSQRISALQSALQQSEVQEALWTYTNTLENDVSTAKLAQELDTLLSEPFFTKYESITPIEQLDFAQAFKVIESTAPTWLALLLQLLSNRRQSWSSYKGTHNLAPVWQRIYLITAIICRSRGRDTANFLAKIMGVYFHSSGVKRRVIEVLAGFGVCDTYKYINRVLAQIADNAKESQSCIYQSKH